MNDYDLFLSYNTLDRDAVETLRRFLESRDIRTFIDKENLVAGAPWPAALEQALDSVHGVAVFIGPHGLGLWQKREMWFALDRQGREEGRGASFPVIPILLPGADPITGFLYLNTWVDLRRDLADPEALQALARAVQGTHPVPPIDDASAPCPYRGLHPFFEEHASLFFGREAFAERLLAAVGDHDLVAVIGPSGSGKSSVVHAGLLPLLRRRHPPLQTWDALSFRPGAQPFHSLAKALVPLLQPDLAEIDRLGEIQRLARRLRDEEVLLQDAVDRLLARSGGTDRLLLVVDQFEELFTQTPAELRKPFIDLLLQALERSPLTVLPTLRADFYGQTIGLSRTLSDRLENSLINLGPMRRDELERAIVEPARRVALNFEAGLVGRMLEDVGAEPGNLPLLEFALSELWLRRAGKQLVHAAYEEIGEVAGAIAKRAETEFKRLSTTEQMQAQRVFTHLVRVAPPEEWSEDTRRRATLRELGVNTAPVVAHLSEARLLVTGSEEEVDDTGQGEESIELAHEALIRHWSRLRGWLDADREFLLWQQRLRFALIEWKRSGEDRDSLLRGAPLVEAEHWLGERPADLDDDMQNFVRAGMTAREKALQARERGRRRRMIGLWVGILVATTFAALAGLGWLRAANEATARAVAERQAVSREFAIRADSQLAVDPERSLLLALEAIQVAPTPEAADALSRAFQESHVRSLLRGHSGSVTGAAVSADAQQVVTTGQDGTARVWNAETGEVEQLLEGHSGPVLDVAYSPDGRRIITAGEDGNALIWDAATGNRLATLSGHKEAIRGVAFSRDGEHAVTGGIDHRVRYWHAGSGQELWQIDDRATVQTVVPSLDGRYLLTAGGNTARVWDIATRELLTELRAHHYNVYDAAFSPDGRFVVTAGEDKTARVWDWRTETQPVRTLEHTSSVHSVSYSPDGRWIVTGTRHPDNAAYLWEADSSDRGTADDIAVFRGHTNAIDGVAFFPDNRRIVTASQDGTARVWGRPLGILRGHNRELTSVAFSPDGRRVVTADRNGAFRVWQSDTGKQLLRIRGHSASIHSARFSADGRLIVTAAGDTRGNNTARVWNATTGNEQAILKGHTSYVTDATFSHDGKFVLTASEDATARLWRTKSGEHLKTFRGHADRLKAAAFSRDGRYVVTASLDGTARIWDTASGDSLRMLKGHERGVNDATFSPNGQWIATTGIDGSARIWDVHSGAQMHLLNGHTDAVWSAAFSPDGRYLLTAGDLTVRVWNTQSGHAQAVYPGHAGRVVDAAFSPDGTRIATASWDKTARIFPCEVCRTFDDLVDLARTRVTRELSARERTIYLHETQED